jgi:hypothetical protein
MLKIVLAEVTIKKMGFLQKIKRNLERNLEKWENGLIVKIHFLGYSKMLNLAGRNF